MSPEEVLAGVAAILQEQAGIDPSRVATDTRLTADLDLDSLTVAECAVVAEQRFGVRIPDSQLGQFKTVGDLVSYIAGQGPSRFA